MVAELKIIVIFHYFLQHIFSAHAPARPFVCPRCDAGFTAQHQLEAHMKVH